MLGSCVRSVLGQDYEDMELVVSDNASDDDTREVLAEFSGDPRLRVLRLDEPVEVTDNWINGVGAARGDYLLLIGDDDYLLPGYARRLHELIERYDSPDCVTYNAYAYAFPGALAGHPHAHFADPFFRWDPELPAEGPIPPAQREQIVRDFFAFRFRIHLNLQTTVVARKAVARMTNGFLKPPFPDFYALNALMMKADKWVYSPQQLIVIGISPKSFGHTVHGHERTEGLEYLGISPDFPGHLPGNEVINGTYAVLLELKRDYGADLAGIEIDRPQYVFNQVYAWYLQMRVGSLPRREVTRRARALAPRDWLALAKGLAPNLKPHRIRRNIRIDRDEPVQHLWPGLEPLPGVDDIESFARWVVSERAGGSAQRRDGAAA
jgi:glycosyltransferase involved in cell wall biosynthesis